jgi:hypothetical protein
VAATEPTACEIDYGYKHLLSTAGKEDDNFMLQKPQQYCLVQCYKMCSYVKISCGVEVLRMRVDFARDEFGKVWLYDVREAWAREANTEKKGGQEALQTLIKSHEYNSQP